LNFYLKKAQQEWAAEQARLDQSREGSPESDDYIPHRPMKLEKRSIKSLSSHNKKKKKSHYQDTEEDDEDDFDEDDDDLDDF
jgi:hypothetical protein